MSNIKLDLSKFKHVKSDDKSTTLRHYEGHELTLAHSKLSKSNKEQLMALAQKAKDKEDKKSDKEMNAKDIQTYAKDVQPKKLAEGGAILKEKYDDKPKAMYADGGDVEQALQFDPSAPVVMPEAPQVDPQQVYQQKFTELKQTFPNQPDEVIDKTVLRDMGADRSNAIQAQEQLKKDAADRKYEQEYQGEIKQELDQAHNQSRQAAGLPPIVQADQGNVPQANIQPQATPAQQAASQAGLPQANMPAAVQTPQTAEGIMHSGYSNQLAGITKEAAAIGALGNAQAAILKKQADDQQSAIQSYKDNYSALENERQALMADVKNGHVNPEKYWTGDAQGNGSHSKVAAAIGMILAGFNPTSSPNAAINFLNHQMEANLNAQKANLDSKQNLLSANLRQFGNLKDATDMTRIMQADMISDKLKMEAAKAQSPMAAAAALKAAGEVQMKYAPLHRQLAMQQAMMNLANDPKGPKDGAIQQMIAYKRAMGDHAGAKELEEHYVPGVGYSPNQPVPQPVREKLIAHQEMSKQLGDLYSFVKNHNTFIPGTPDYVQGQQKAMALQTMIREGMLNTVYREGEQPLLDKMLNTNPAGMMKMLKTIPQLKELTHQNDMKYNNLKKAYGLPVTQEAVTKVVNGVTYQQGPQGWHKVK